jgi:alpha-galactosidase
MPLPLRCATALFGHMGIEWDISQASREELDELAAWIELHKRHRDLIHSGRMVRLDSGEDTGWMHGVVAADRCTALMCYAQLDVPRHDQAVAMRIPGLDPARRYQVTEVTPGQRAGLVNAVEASGAALAEIGLAIPPQRPLTAAILLIQAR